MEAFIMTGSPRRRLTLLCVYPVIRCGAGSLIYLCAHIRQVTATTVRYMLVSHACLRTIRNCLVVQCFATMFSNNHMIDYVRTVQL